VSYGKLDIWDISHLIWWRCEEINNAENQLKHYFHPYLNLEIPKSISDEIVQIEESDGEF